MGKRLGPLSQDYVPCISCPAPPTLPLPDLCCSTLNPLTSHLLGSQPHAAECSPCVPGTWLSSQKHLRTPEAGTGGPSCELSQLLLMCCSVP